MCSQILSPWTLTVPCCFFVFFEEYLSVFDYRLEWMRVCISSECKDLISVSPFTSLTFTGGYWQNTSCTSLNSKLIHLRSSGDITSHLCTSCFFSLPCSALLPHSYSSKHACYSLLTKGVLWGLRHIFWWIFLKQTGVLLLFSLICSESLAELWRFKLHYEE